MQLFCVIFMWFCNCLDESTWLRQYATSRKIMGSVPDVTEFFALPECSSRTMALGSSQPLAEMSSRNLLGGG
jgi:hypothetical protein